MLRREGDRYMSFEGSTWLHLRPYPCTGGSTVSAPSRNYDGFVTPEDLSEEESATSSPSSPPDTPSPTDSYPDSPTYPITSPGRRFEPEFTLTEDGRILVTLDEQNKPPLEYFGEVGLHCYNVLNGTNLQFSGLRSSTGHGYLESSGEFFGDVTILNSDCELETGIHYEVDKGFCLSMITTLCRLQPPQQTPERESDFDKLAVDDVFKGHMPWKFPWEMATRHRNKFLDKRKYYVMKKAEREENKEWLHLYVDLALFSQWESFTQVEWAKPLELRRVIVQTREGVEPKEKAKAKDAIFYIVFRTCHGYDYYAIIRRRTDGKPEHMSLEFRWVA